MEAFIASLLILGLALATILAVASAPSLREAIREIAPELEEKYFSAARGRRLNLDSLRPFEIFARPPAVLDGSPEFRASLRLVRILLVALAAFAISLATFVLVT